MNIKRFVIVVFVILSISIVIISLTLKKPDNSKFDTVKINDIVQSLVNQWGEFETLPCTEYGIEYTVLDSNGKYIASTDDKLSLDMLSAIKNGDTIVDIYDNKTYLGKLVINNNSYETMKKYRYYVIMYVSVVLILVSLVCTVYIIYIDKKIFMPFRKLQKFAINVAQGKLDDLY